jgi:hypothetical protein
LKVSSREQARKLYQRSLQHALYIAKEWQAMMRKQQHTCASCTRIFTFSPCAPSARCALASSSECETHALDPLELWTAHGARSWTWGRSACVHLTRAFCARSRCWLICTQIDEYAHKACSWTWGCSACMH